MISSFRGAWLSHLPKFGISLLVLLTTCSEDLITDFIIWLMVGSVSVLAEKIHSQVMSAHRKSFPFTAVLYSGYEFGFEFRLRILVLELPVLRIWSYTNDLTLYSLAFPYVQWRGQEYLTGLPRSWHDMRKLAEALNRVCQWREYSAHVVIVVIIITSGKVANTLRFPEIDCKVWDYSKILGSLPTPRYIFCRPAFWVFSLLISLWFRSVFRMGERAHVSWPLRLSGAYTITPNCLGTVVVTQKRIISLLTDEVQLKICRLPR